MSRRTQDVEKAERIKSVMLQTHACQYSDSRCQEVWERLPVDCDEVYPGLFIGDRQVTRHGEILAEMGGAPTPSVRPESLKIQSWVRHLQLARGRPAVLRPLALMLGVIETLLDPLEHEAIVDRTWLKRTFDMNAAMNKRFLRTQGISHVVNTAEGSGLGMVNTDQDFYRDMRIEYMGLPLMDLTVTDVAKYFDSVANFIHEALRKNGRVLVHCYMGMSRSAIFSLAYLVLKCGMSACTAMVLVRRKRNIHPNDGFIHQLAQLDNKIMRRQEIY